MARSQGNHSEQALEQSPRMLGPDKAHVSPLGHLSVFCSDYSCCQNIIFCSVQLRLRACSFVKCIGIKTTCIRMHRICIHTDVLLRFSSPVIFLVSTQPSPESRWIHNIRFIISSSFYLQLEHWPKTNSHHASCLSHMLQLLSCLLHTRIIHMSPSFLSLVPANSN